jgi:hypothetical protein
MMNRNVRYLQAILWFFLATFLVPSCSGHEEGEGRSPRSAAPRIILDGDLGPDPCDFATLAMAHNLHESGEIELIGIMGTLPDPDLVPTLDVFNKLYDHDIPIGTYKNEEDPQFNGPIEQITQFLKIISPATRGIVNEYPEMVEHDRSTVPNSVALYRRILSEREDKSVTVLTLGQLYNLRDLLLSGADEYSPLTGMELVEQKVDRFVLMIGSFFESPLLPDLQFYQEAYFSEGMNLYGIYAILARLSAGSAAEYNAQGFYPGLTQGVFEQLDQLDAPKIILGNEAGPKVPTGDSYNALDLYHPVRMAFYLNNLLSQMVTPGVAKNNPAYDELALLYLAQGKGTFLEEMPGHAEFDHEGISRWDEEPRSNHTRIALTPNANEQDRLSDLIESLVMGRY